MGGVCGHGANVGRIRDIHVENLNDFSYKSGVEYGCQKKVRTYPNEMKEEPLGLVQSQIRRGMNRGRSRSSFTMCVRWRLFHVGHFKSLRDVFHGVA